MHRVAGTRAYRETPEALTGGQTGMKVLACSASRPQLPRPKESVMRHLVPPFFQLIAASTDTPEVHLAWIKTPRKRGGLGYMQIPILADVTKVTCMWGLHKKKRGWVQRTSLTGSKRGMWPLMPCTAVPPCP